MDIFLSILQGFGFPAIFSGLIAILINRYYKNKDTKKDEVEKAIEKIDQLDHQLIDLSEQTLKLEEMAKSISIFKNAVLAVLRDRIIQMYNYFYKEKGFMPIHSKESLEDMYKQYELLGGNGLITSLVLQMRGLPSDLIKNDCECREKDHQHNGNVQHNQYR